MSQTLTTASLKALFRFPFQGRDWKNRFLIGAGLNLASFFIPILPSIFVTGYSVEITRRAVAGEEPELPAWDDWGRLAIDGLRAWLVGLVYLLPGTLVLVAGMFAYFAGILAVPILSESASPDAAGLAGLLTLGSMGVFFLSLSVGMLLLFLGAIPLPAAIAHFVLKDEVAAGFRVRQWWPILRANALGYVVAWVVALGLYTVLAQALTIAYYTMVLCCLIPFLAAPVGFYLGLVGAALFGRTYHEGAGMVEERTEVVTA
jgi:hypothetical protein